MSTTSARQTTERRREAAPGVWASLREKLEIADSILTAEEQSLLDEILRETSEEEDAEASSSEMFVEPNDDGWQPSEDQSEALRVLLDALREPGVYVLTGAAGSGKTTLSKALLCRLSKAWDVVLLAPTWRAANRLRDATGREVVTIHRAVYGKPVEQRQCPKCSAWSEGLTQPADVEVDVSEPDGPAMRARLPRYVCSGCSEPHLDATRFPERLEFVRRERGGGDDGAPPEYQLVAVDESSMVGRKVASDVVAAFPGARFLFIGDANQLPPVEEQAVTFDGEPPPATFDLLRPTAALHRVHRQAAGNPALALAHTLKVTPEQSAVEWPFPRELRGVHIETKVPLDVPARWAANLRHASEDLALIALSNRTRAQLNRLVRHYTGALACAQAQGAALIPGDRLLARGNAAGVYNGEVWTLCAAEPIPAGAALLDERGRAARRHPLFEHDRALEEGVAVLRVEIALVGGESQRLQRLIVAPRGASDLPLLESDMVLAGVEPGRARARCAAVVRAWRGEYRKCVEDHEKEFDLRRAQALDKRVAVARLVGADGNRSLVVRSLQALEKLGVDPREVDRLRGLDRYTERDLASIWTREDCAAECADAQAYCERVYGALRPDEAVQVDYGECLTAHACQGSSAKNVGVVFDGAFWGMWRNDRRGALQFAYTSVTRTSDRLALFGIARQS